MGVKVTNNGYATISAGITSTDTTITLDSGQGARFPTLGAGDYFYGTLVDTSNNIEIVKVTARSSDSMTVVRGQDNTTARAYSIGDRFELRPTAALFEDIGRSDILVDSGGTTRIQADTSGVDITGQISIASTLLANSSRIRIPSAAGAAASTSQGDMYLDTNTELMSISGGSYEDWFGSPSSYLYRSTDTAVSVSNGNTAAWKNIYSFSGPNFGARQKILTFSHNSYIQSGATYYTWRLYNAREGAAIPVLASSVIIPNSISSGGGILYRGAVHSYSPQPYVHFNAKDVNSGDTIYLQMAGSNGSGDVLLGSTQILYSRYQRVWIGAVTGNQD